MTTFQGGMTPLEEWTVPDVVSFLRRRPIKKMDEVLANIESHGVDGSFLQEYAEPEVLAELGFSKLECAALRRDIERLKKGEPASVAAAPQPQPAVAPSSMNQGTNRSTANVAPAFNGTTGPPPVFYPHQQVSGDTTSSSAFLGYPTAPQGGAVPPPMYSGVDMTQLSQLMSATGFAAPGSGASVVGSTPQVDASHFQQGSMPQEMLAWLQSMSMYSGQQGLGSMYGYPAASVTPTTDDQQHQQQQQPLPFSVADAAPSAATSVNDHAGFMLSPSNERASTNSSLTTTASPPTSAESAGVHLDAMVGDFGDDIEQSHDVHSLLEQLIDEPDHEPVGYAPSSFAQPSEEADYHEGSMESFDHHVEESDAPNLEAAATHLLTSQEFVEGDRVEVFLFVDDSNVWIESKKLAAKRLPNIKMDEDPRFRISLHGLTDLALEACSRGGKKARIKKCFLFGGNQPSNDAVWSAARDRKFEVQVFDRKNYSPYGKEKEVDQGMAVELVNQAHRVRNNAVQHTVFVVISGDRDIRPAIKGVLDKGIRVMSIGYKHNVAREYLDLANNNKRYRVVYLDDHLDRIGFTSIRSTRMSTIDPAHALVVDLAKLPNNPMPAILQQEQFAEHFLITKLLRSVPLFYVTYRLPLVILEFPRTSLVEAHKSTIDALNVSDDPNQRIVMTYKVWNDRQKQGGRKKSPDTAPHQKSRHNPFELLEEEEDQSSDAEDDRDVHSASSSSHPDAVQASPSHKIVTVGGISIVADGDYGHVLDSEDEEFVAVESRTNAAKREAQRRKAQTSCDHGIHCVKTFQCPYHHSEKDKAVWRRFENANVRINWRFYKSKRCNRKDPHSKELCGFSHGPENGDKQWCLHCRSWGHVVDDCPHGRL